MFRGVPISSSQAGLCTETQVVQRSTKIVHRGTDCVQRHRGCVQRHRLCIEAPDYVRSHRDLCTEARRELCNDARGAEGTGVSAASVRTDSGVD